MKRAKRLLKIGNADVKSALGFIWLDKTHLYVVGSLDDLTGDRFTPDDIRPMDELENAFRESSFLKSISWLNVSKGCIVRQGAKQVTFNYGTEKSVIHIQ